MANFKQQIILLMDLLISDMLRRVAKVMEKHATAWRKDWEGRKGLLIRYVGNDTLRVYNDDPGGFIAESYDSIFPGDVFVLLDIYPTIGPEYLLLKVLKGEKVWYLSIDPKFKFKLVNGSK